MLLFARQNTDCVFFICFQMKSKRWDFALDISAPQFIIPENFQDQNSTMVLFDLGRLKLHNLNAAAAADSTDVNPQEEDGKSRMFREMCRAQCWTLWTPVC